MSVQWTPSRDDQLRQLHGTTTIVGVAEAMGVTRGSIRARVTHLGIRKRSDKYSAAELAEIRRAYENSSFGEDVRLDDLAVILARPKTSICRQARILGLSNIGRPKKRVHKIKFQKYGSVEAFHAAQPQLVRDRIAANGHPRGMLGKKHSTEVKERLRASSTAWWDSMSKTEREEFSTRAMRAALDKNGRLGPINPRRETTWKAGWREIADRRHYFRSRWEANYARYLQWLKERGDIIDWEYEPKTFWFEGIKRGVRSYLPDFRVHELNGSKPFHEVKGWMDARSKTTLKRMAKYHPQETVILIRAKEYKALSRFGALIGGWE